MKKEYIPFRGYKPTWKKFVKKVQRENKDIGDVIDELIKNYLKNEKNKCNHRNSQ